MIFIGIDNGLSGGYAVIDDEERLLAYGNMPLILSKTKTGAMHKEINVEKLSDLLDAACDGSFKYVVQELAHSMPGQGVVSMFNYGQAYGEVRSLLKMKSDRLYTVPPQTWQKKMLDVGYKGKTKEYSLAKVKEFYPDCKVTNQHGQSDAILMARYGLERYRTYGIE